MLIIRGMVQVRDVLCMKQTWGRKGRQLEKEGARQETGRQGDRHSLLGPQCRLVLEGKLFAGNREHRPE